MCINTAAKTSSVSFLFESLNKLLIMVFHKLILPSLLSVFRLYGDGPIQNPGTLVYPGMPHYTSEGPSYGNHLRATPTFSVHDYYFSVQPVTWAIAEYDCRSIFGNRKSGLLSIESKEELAFLSSISKTFGSGKRFWTSAAYQMATPNHFGRWIWDLQDRQVPIEPFISVDGGIPTSEEQLALNLEDRFNPSLEIIQNSQPQRYICKVDREELPPASEQHSYGNRLRSTPTFSVHDYYFSVQPVTWAIAEYDCRSIFGNGRKSGLLSVESKEELAFLSSISKTFGSGKRFWTSGAYQMSTPNHSGRWIWDMEDRQVPIEPFISVDGGIPTSEEQLALNLEDRFNPRLEIIQNSQPQRYICKLTREEPLPASEEHYYGNRPTLNQIYPSMPLYASEGHFHGNHLQATSTFSVRDYYFSVQPVTWAIAEHDCRSIFGNRKSGLLSVESNEELAFLSSISKTFGSGKRYWTSGAYQMATPNHAGRWIWDMEEGQVPIGDFIPLNGEVTSSEDQLALNLEDRFNPSLEVIQNSQPQRYICEVSREVPPPGCEQFSGSMSQCLNSALGCSFCPLEAFHGARCDTKENLILNGCNGEDQCRIDESPRMRSVTVYGGRNSPSTESMTFCPNMTRDGWVTFNVESHPLDVYVLMDLSASMHDDRQNVVSLSNNLVAEVQKLSRDFRIGFGAFVDKPNVQNPTDYSFRNVLPLTSDATRFKLAVSTSTLSGGGDPFESQLDAIYQASVCTDQIGWRPNSRHILLIMTDDGYHQAGDGMPYGLIPFNGQCSLDASGKYDKERFFDYPSTTQIINILSRNQIVPIFAVEKNALQNYQSLVASIQPSAIGTLQPDSSNVIQLLVAQYDVIARKIELEIVGSLHLSVSVRFFSTCNDPSGILRETNVCEDIGSVGSVAFLVKIKMGDCPAWGTNYNEIIKIRPKGLPTGVEFPVRLYCKYQ